MKITHVVGARPNFVKAAPVMRAMQSVVDFQQRVVHTGQHYDAAMSENIMTDVGMMQPSVNLGIGSGSQAQQLAAAMVALEKEFLENRPDLVLVYGDVNSTFAAAFVASRLEVELAHVEAGLRSYDRSMPEEVNRVLVDALSDIHFTTSSEAQVNLEREGCSLEALHFVGNTMIDSLNWTAKGRRESRIIDYLGLDEPFFVATLHRPSNVDDVNMLAEICINLKELSNSILGVFPVHPRTLSRIRMTGINFGPRVKLIEPLGYLDFTRVIEEASFVVTDSGGVQEECLALATPCLTVRSTTERPITVTMSGNMLVQVGHLHDGLELSGQLSPSLPPLWDGSAALRIVDALRSAYL